jgi:hypothetical protein
MQCPHCQLTMQDAAHLAGQIGSCPQCGGQFIVPAGFDPYYTWLGIPPNDQPANHYRLLGVQLFESNPSVIEHAADRQMKHLQSLSIGPNAALSQQLLTEVSTARVQLLNPVRKSAYDQQLGGAMAGPPPVVQEDVATQAWDNAPAMLQTPGTGSNFGSTPTSRRVVRRSSRQSSAGSFLSSIWIVGGGGTGLVLGALIIFYLTGQDFLGLSGKLKKSTPEAGTRPEAKPRTKIPGPVDPKPTRPKNVSPAPGAMTPNPAETPPSPTIKPPEAAELLALAPAFLPLQAVESSASIEWITLTSEPDEPIGFSLICDAAALPPHVSLRVVPGPTENEWWIEQFSDEDGTGSRLTVGIIRRDGIELTFSWATPLAESEIRGQLSNCLLEVSVGTEVCTIPLREPIDASFFTIELDGDTQKAEFDIANTPTANKLFVRVKQLINFPKGAKLRGDKDTFPFTRPVIIEFADMDGPELELRFVRLTTGRVVAQLKPTYVETANRRFDLTLAGLQKLYDSQQKKLYKAQADLTNAQRMRSNAQIILQQSPPSDEGQRVALALRKNVASRDFQASNRAIQNAEEIIAEANARLNAIPTVQRFVESLHEVARVQFVIFAQAGKQELVLVEGTGE